MRLDEAPKSGRSEADDLQRRRGQALAPLDRLAEGILAFSERLGLGGDNAYRFESRGRSRLALGDDASIRLSPNDLAFAAWIALALNNRIWLPATGPVRSRDPEQAIVLACRAVDLIADKALYLNTLGVSHYRFGQIAEAVPALERRLGLSRGGADAFDLFYLAVAYNR